MSATYSHGTRRHQYLYMRTLRQRFNEKWEADPTTGCWMWTGKSAGGTRGTRGQIRIGPANMGYLLAHRASWILHRGEIPSGMLVCHKCDRPKCVNPDHLFLGTHHDNNQDMVAKGRHVFGVRIHSHRLTPEQVAEIRATPASTPARVLASKFGVDRSTVCYARRGATWKEQSP